MAPPAKNFVRFLPMKHLLSYEIQNYHQLNSNAVVGIDEAETAEQGVELAM